VIPNTQKTVLMQSFSKNLTSLISLSGIYFLLADELPEAATAEKHPCNVLALY